MDKTSYRSEWARLLSCAGPMVVWLAWISYSIMRLIETQHPPASDFDMAARNYDLSEIHVYRVDTEWIAARSLEEAVAWYEAEIGDPPHDDGPLHQVKDLDSEIELTDEDTGKVIAITFRRAIDAYYGGRDSYSPQILFSTEH